MESDESELLNFTAVDLFSGVGGLTLGLKQAGFTVVAAVENDSVSLETYRANHPEVRVFGEDIRKIDPYQFIASIGFKEKELDLLAACPPCQGFSTMVSLNGSRCIYDERNDLISDVVRFVSVLHPKCIMIENVPNLVKDIRFKAFCSKISSFGYTFKYRIRDAQKFGLSQRRKRLVFVASRIGDVEFPHPENEVRNIEDIIGLMPVPGLGNDPLHDYKRKHSKKIIELIKKIPKDGGGRSDLPLRDQLNCHKRTNGFSDVYGRMSWKKVSPTITSGCINPSKGRFIHPIQNRAITLREAALIQGFPNDYIFSLRKGKHKVASLIANAFPPIFGKKHAVPIRELISEKIENGYVELI